MSEKSHCRTRLISDAPTLEDAFGPHKRVATAIADLIQSEEGGRSIGLEGGWGSGKSTAVKLLIANLKCNENRTVMVFDAWAHGGDPLRRTFLESLISHLQRVNWIDSAVWNKRREELARRRKTLTTKSVPLLTGLGKSITFTLLLVPIGLTLFSTGLRESAPFWNVIVGGLLAVAPLFVLLAKIAGRFTWRRLRALFGYKNSPVTDEVSPWALLAQRSITETQTQTIENPDPTSVEFEETFTEIMREALVKVDRRIVLVLDNLDRVVPSDALAIWSTLQTFLQHSEHREKDWFTKVWVLIPYDPQGIHRLWDKEQAQDGKGSVASSFLDKSFQVRFEVPSPVLSDWRKYLVEYLREALPDHNSAEFHATYRLFAILRGNSGQSPTPREIKLYVNQLGAIHRQWQDAYPLPHVAYYVLLRRQGQNIAEGLLQGKIPGPDVVGLLGSDIRDNLAALNFSVEVDLARQLLLQDPIAEALSQANVDRLKELAQYPGGFWEVLEHVTDGLVTEWAKGEPAKLANAAYCLAESKLLEDTTRAEARTAITALRKAALEVKSWLPFDSNLARGIASLCRQVPDRDFASHLLNAISLSPIGGETGGSDPAQASTWIDALLVVLKELRSLGLADAYSQGVEVPTDPTSWISACHRATEQDPQAEFWSFLRPKASVADIAAHFASLPPEGKFTTQHVSTIRVLKATKAEFSWTNITNAISTRLQAGNAVPSAELNTLLEALCELRAVDATARTTLTTLATQGHVLHHLYQAVSEGNQDAVALCSFVFLREVPSAAVPSAAGNSAAGHSHLMQMFQTPEASIAERFVELLRRYEELNLLFKVLDEAPASKPLIMLCLKQVSKGKDAKGLFTPEVVMARWAFLRTEFDQGQRDSHEFDRFIASLAKETELVAQVCNMEFDPTQARLYIALVRAGAASDARSRPWCLRGLKAVDTAEWRSQLQQEGDLAELVIELLKQGVEVTLTRAYQDALVEHGKAAVVGQFSPSHLVDSWGELLKPLGTGSMRKMLRRGLYEAASNADGKINPAFFHIYGDEIADTEILREDNRAVFRFFSPLLNNRNAEGLRWIAKLLTSHQGFLDEYPHDPVDDFKDRIRTAISNDPGDEASPAILEIAEILQIEPTVEQPPAEQADDMQPDNPNPETAQ